MPTLKFRTKNGQHILEYNGKEYIFTKLHDALEYIFYQKFIAQVAGKPIGVGNDTLYPVYSLRPPVASKTTYFYDLGAEKI